MAGPFKIAKSDEDFEDVQLPHYEKLEDPDDAQSAMPFARGMPIINGDGDPRYDLGDTGPSRRNLVPSRPEISPNVQWEGERVCKDILQECRSEILDLIEHASTIESVQESEAYVKGGMERKITLKTSGPYMVKIRSSLRVFRADNFVGDPYFIFRYGDVELFGNTDRKV